MAGPLALAREMATELRTRLLGLVVGSACHRLAPPTPWVGPFGSTIRLGGAGHSRQPRGLGRPLGPGLAMAR
jgi:hypothetical protein